MLKVNCALRLVPVLPLLCADLGTTSGMKTGRSSSMVYYFNQKHSSQPERNHNQIKEIHPLARAHICFWDLEHDNEKALRCSPYTSIVPFVLNLLDK